MAASTSIEWAANADGSPGATWNPIRARDRETGLTGTFCVHASEGCRNCYAETLQARKLPGNGIGLPYTAPNLARVEHYLDERMLAAPLKRRKPTTYFLSSMTDVFGEWVPDAMLDRLFAVMALCQRHTFIVVTKRAERMRVYLTDPATRGRQHRAVQVVAKDARLPSTFNGDIVSAQWKLGARDEPLPNVWLLVSVEDNANLRRIFDLLETPAAVRGVSIEPMIGPVDLVTGRNFLERIETDNNGPILPGLDWVICCGESGRNARPMHPDWARALRDQCAAAGVPFFFKQWGEHAVVYDRDVDDPDWRLCDVRARETPRGQWLNLKGGQGFHGERVVRTNPVGKAKSGRTLDLRTHDERPPIRRAS